uniref:CUB domain-containing protein n=1 Tax=Sinocyclocheilus rhinocerous TaxID=307959 RepID=A0A673JHE2_9TELE
VLLIFLIYCYFFLLCGGELTNTYGDIKSPGYPGNYPPNRDCYWMVNVNPGLLITFAFGTLSLEHHDNCNFDYLEVKLVTSWIHFKGVFCAYVLKSPILSTTNGLWIRFKSDSSVSRAGFRAMYELGETLKPPFLCKCNAQSQPSNACLHKNKTMIKQHCGMQNHILCEQPLTVYLTSCVLSKIKHNIG